jgi:hypothetical protein
MHSYRDRHTHDFFFSRDYPDVSLLDRVFANLQAEPQPKEALRKALAIEEELFDKTIEKLWIHKGAVLDFAEDVSQGGGLWRPSYILQGEQKRAQVDQMIRFAESNQCRMMSLVRHFGDTSDGATACGVCDFCAPAKCVAQRFRNATELERGALYRVLSVMQSVRTKSTGKLYAELYPGNEISRDNFEEVLGAMARAELLTFADAVFEKQGKQIPYRTVNLTPAGRAANQTTSVLFVMKDAQDPSGKHTDIYIAEIVTEDEEGRIAPDEQHDANGYLLAKAPALLKALEDAFTLLDRISDTLHYEDGLPVTALESRDIEIIYGDAVPELARFETLIRQARREI